MSDFRSFGSNFLPSSQSRKISIGILIDSLANKKLGAAKEDEVAVPDAEKEMSRRGGPAEDKRISKDRNDAGKGKQTGPPELVTSPWITPRSLHRKAQTTDDTVIQGEEASKLPGTSGTKNGPSRGEDVTAPLLDEFLSNQAPSFHSGDGKQKFGGLTYKRKGSKDGNSQREDFTFVTPQVPVADQTAIHDKSEGRGTETLKMKLWEILGTVSSPKSQLSNSQVRETGPKNLNEDQMCDAGVKLRQNSDTIETDSENADPTEKRPLTRSLTRKRASVKKQPDRPKAGTSSARRGKLKEKNIFSFEDGSFRKGDIVANGSASMSTRKKAQIKSCSIEQRKICLTEKFKDAENQGAGPKTKTSMPSEKTSLSYKMGNSCVDPLTRRSETSVPSQRITSLSKKMKSFSGCPPKNKRGCPEQKKENQERDSCHSPKRDSHNSLGRNYYQSSGRGSPKSPSRKSPQSLTKHQVDEQCNVDTPLVPENEDQQEDSLDVSGKNAVDQQNDGFQSPTFKVNTPNGSSSPSSTPKTDLVKGGVVCSPARNGRMFTFGETWSFGNLQTSKAGRSSSIAQTKSVNFAAEPIDSPASNGSPMERKRGVEDCLSESSSEDGNPEGPEEGSPSINGLKEEDTFSPATATAETTEFTIYPTKRLRNHEGNKVSKFSPTSDFPKDLGETEWVPDPSGQNQEDELERVVMLFAFALENAKNKMKSATKQKSSEILMSVSEEIRLKFQNIESQIQTDMGKLSSISKSKRKRLEMKFQEQQDQLKLIHDKFKQDIYMHLEVCKSTLEELEVHQIELKGTAKKQKALHQKLVMQVEEGIETQLNDAERRITAVHKLAREKMLQLRLIITECLSGGILN